MIYSFLPLDEVKANRAVIVFVCGSDMRWAENVVGTVYLRVKDRKTHGWTIEWYHPDHQTVHNCQNWVFN